MLKVFDLNPAFQLNIPFPVIVPHTHNKLGIGSGGETKFFFKYKKKLT